MGSFYVIEIMASFYVIEIMASFHTIEIRGSHSSCGHAASYPSADIFLVLA